MIKLNSQQPAEQSSDGGRDHEEQDDSNHYYTDDDSLFGKMESQADFDNYLLRMIQMGKIDLGSPLLGQVEACGTGIEDEVCDESDKESVKLM